MAFDRTTAIVSDLAGRVLASSLGSIASCAGGTVALLAWSRRPNTPVAATCAVIGPGPETRGQVARRKPSLDDQRGACHRARIGGFKWSSQHLDGGGCDEGWETALGSGATSRVAGIAW